MFLWFHTTGSVDRSSEKMLEIGIFFFFFQSGTFFKSRAELEEPKNELASVEDTFQSKALPRE